MQLLRIDSSQIDILKRATTILTAREKKRFLLVSGVQLFLNLLDLLAVALTGVLGALAISGISANRPGNKINTVLTIMHIQTWHLQNQVAIIGLIVAILMTLKTFASVVLVRRTSYFLSRRGAVISGRLISKLLNEKLTVIQSMKQQEILYAVTTGVDAITLGILNTLAILVSDISLLVILGIGLFFLDWIVAVLTILIFGGVAFALYKLLEVRSREIGFTQAKLSMEGNQKILEVISSYRELVVRDRRGYYADEISKIRLEMADNSAEKSFMPNITKYVLEITMIYAALIIAASQFLLKDAVHAIATLSVFLVASSRMSPSVLRVQQSFLIMKGSLGAAKPTLDLLDRLSDVPPVRAVESKLYFNYGSMNLEIKVNKLQFKYPDSASLAISDIDFHIPAGTSLAIVGPSGSGKTTFVDLLLGILEPSNGEILIGTNTPNQLIEKYPGAIAYVPQDVVIMNGSIRENIAMGFDSRFFSDDDFLAPLRIARINQFVQSLPDGIDTILRDRGSNLSGGQRQRIGIARALFTRPRILVLDEATSALDGETEASISEALASLHGETTVIVIAHRLSSIMHAEQVAYFDHGKVVATGTFESLRKAVPDFDNQAKLMGID